MEIITSTKNPLIVDTCELKNSQYRHEKKRVLLEGLNCIRDVAQKIAPETVFISNYELFDTLSFQCSVYRVSEEVMKKLSSVKSPEGIVAIFSMPPPSALSNCCRIVVCDGVSDPGNLGTIIRTTFALGWDGVFVVEGSCDMFNEKALRAAKGATFWLPWKIGSPNDLKKIIDINCMTVLIADMKGEVPETFVNEKSIALVLGNEAHGVRINEDILYKRVCVPMKGVIDSLNVAAACAIITYVLKNR